MKQARDKQTDIIIGRGLLSAEAIAAELRARLVRVLTRSTPGPVTIDALMAIARQTLADFEPILAQNLASSTLAGWLLGAGRVLNQLPRPVQKLLEVAAKADDAWRPPPVVPRGLLLGGAGNPTVRFPQIEEAARSIFSRRVLPYKQFKEAKLRWEQNVFSVAGGWTDLTLQKIRDTLAANIAQGASLGGFKKALEESIGTSQIGPGHLENIYRTNIQTAYADGHELLASHPIVREVFPYQSYNPIHDSRCRPEHLALEKLGIDGTNVYRKDDYDFWDLFFPPWSWQCRCGYILMTIEAAARAGVKEAAEWQRTGVRPQLKSRLPFIPFRPPPGFGGRVIRSAA